MYQIDSSKRYIVKSIPTNPIAGPAEWRNVELIAIEDNFIAFKDETGKEVILAGNRATYVQEM